jgi:SAM-dependent methyltransferase
MIKNIEKIFHKLLEPSLSGETLNETQGGGDPALVAETWSSIILSNIHIPEKSIILDYGCGVGRLALGLLKERPDLRYVGVDIVPKFIEFGQNNITPLNSNFTFHLVNDNNPLYKKYQKGNFNQAKLQDGIFQNKFDFVFALSLFTHLPLSDANKIMSKVASVMHDESVFMMSAFVIDNKAKKSIKNENSFPFSRASTKLKKGYYEDTYNGENSAIGFLDSDLEKLSSNNGFSLIKQINGFWRGAPARKRKSLQDILFFEKEVYLPKKINSETYFSKYPDVRDSGMSANFHYLAFGKDEGRSVDIDI